jgi:uncharacterized MAPEG superfamily protein
VPADARLAGILHGILSMADLAALRSTVWTAGCLCVLGLFIAAA